MYRTNLSESLSRIMLSLVDPVFLQVKPIAETCTVTKLVLALNYLKTATPLRGCNLHGLVIATLLVKSQEYWKGCLDIIHHRHKFSMFARTASRYRVFSFPTPRYSSLTRTQTSTVPPDNYNLTRWVVYQQLTLQKLPWHQERGLPPF